ncbi:stalk domain-containing protein [Cohnella panacarvi]|uniref:stalk domain-containing protein n=1 Tax=Cohnella panacarvi TaxID=400776 RepID=UPI0004796148|nr:stalk domain-containing protein [Cohnella panacarvi]
MNHIIRKVTLAVLILLMAPAPIFAEPSPTGQELIILKRGTNVIIHNGVKVAAAQPLVVKKGVTYIAAKSIAKELYGTITYEAASKQYIIQQDATKLGFVVNDRHYRLNGVKKTGIGAPYLEKGTLMVPLKTVANSFGIELTDVPSAKRIELNWSMKPVAKFSVSDTNPYATQTEIAYKDEAFHPRGYAIVEEKWENQYAIFDKQGSYTVTRRVKDEKGVWSDPYSVVVNVKPPNEPPTAMFALLKGAYKIGEYIAYSDRSTDDENAIASRAWTNKQDGFFQPGEKTITLRVTDVHGATSEYSKTITILDEIAYTKTEFDLLHTPIGAKLTLDGAGVLEYRMLDYRFTDGSQSTLVVDDSPESIVEEGIYYEADHLSGYVRFLVHKQNKRSTPAKIYVIATNTSAATANVTMGPIGIGGPHRYVYVAGKASVGKYLEARKSGQSSLLTIPAGESRIVFPEISAKTLEPGQVFSSYADLNSDQPIKLRFVAVDAGKDVFSSLPSLAVMQANGHIRGTFERAFRTIEVDEPLGDQRARMLFGDNMIDPWLKGVDQVGGYSTYDDGNYGVVYSIRLNHVLPNTVIAINPRGGFYAGAFDVNGKVIYTTTNTVLNNSNEASVLHRTGLDPETVTITFTPAPGSNLPINLLFLPIKE